MAKPPPRDVHGYRSRQRRGIVTLSVAIPQYKRQEGPMSRRRFLKLMAGGGAVLAAPAVLRAEALASVKIATGVTPPSIHNIYLHVAYERGFLRDNGINVKEFIQLRGGPLATQAIAAGQVDITASDPEGVLAAAVSGHPIRAVTAPGAHLS